MKRFAIFAYGVACYVAFLVTFVYAIGFIGNLFVPRSIDSIALAPVAQAVLIDLCLLAVFAVQHSLMARPVFKRWWTRTVPPSAERSTYVLFSSLALILLFLLWEPIGGVIWHVDDATGRALVLAAYAAGWALLFVATFAIDHFELFGLRQVWTNLRGQRDTPIRFKTPWLYRQIRHPIYLGWLAIVWATPTMTAAHLVFAAGCTAYIFAGIRFEERDLVNAHPEYADYRESVPMVVPSLKRRAGTAALVEESN